MKSELMYVELKSGYADNGPAWIGTAFFSRTFQTIYFNGRIFKKKQGIAGNYRDLQTGDEYWISGIKKRGTNRHWAGGGIIEIDHNVVEEYLNLIERSTLPKNFRVTTLNSVPAIKKALKIENTKQEPEFDWSLRFKELHDLTDKELQEVSGYYSQLDFNTIHKKARKGFIDKMRETEAELVKRKSQKLSSA